jgi:hypothetical protein
LLGAFLFSAKVLSKSAVVAENKGLPLACRNYHYLKSLLFFFEFASFRLVVQKHKTQGEK